MLLPTCFFNFLEEANDYYFPPLVGSYLRYLRVAVLILALLMRDKDAVPKERRAGK